MKARTTFLGQFSHPTRFGITTITLFYGLCPLQGIGGEFVASVFTGVALTQDDDLRLRQAGGTDLTFHGVSYRGKDFESPIYYGARLAYFLSEQSHWGFGAEFF